MTRMQTRFPAMDTQRATPLTKSTFAYAELRRRIVSGELAPGTRLDLSQLCDVLEVSRMPVREALSRLEAQGLVEIRPQASTVVCQLSSADLRDTYGARIALEGMLAGAAASRIDSALLDEMHWEIDRQVVCAQEDDLAGFLVSDRSFHERLYDRAGMPRTRDIVMRLRDVADRYIYMFLKAASHREDSIAEHRLLLRHCSSGDPEKLRAAVEAHIANGREKLLEQFKLTDPEPADIGHV